jgi:eukaryotic-like serine/threonine-protein kinase
MTTPSSLSGQRFGAYEIGPLLGVGGMGEVYRARDSKLNRDVAIKVLLPAVVSDPERLARFRREAQTLASLNHSGIAQIYGLEDGSSGPFLVMELVDGATLADRLASGPLALDEATAIARQIVDALEAAHERGIIHRDLKPANIKICDDGSVKILDFGLAKALDPSTTGSHPELANSPTITSPAMTQAGVILGTAAYMSPEQAKGRVVDKRTDVWAFGCVLYEMLTARRAFHGEDVTDTIAAVVRGDPDWTALPRDTPPQIHLLLKRCLEKERRARIGDIAVARFLLNETLATQPVNRGPSVTHDRASRSLRLLMAALGGFVLCGALAASVWSFLRPAEVSVTPARFTITPPAAAPFLLQGNDRDLAIAPDGSFMVYRSGTAALLRPHLMIRALNELEPRMLAGTENARFPFISADGRWVGFQVGNDLRKVAVSGGPTSVVCLVSGNARGATWGDDDSIVFATTEGMRRVPASGGEPQPLTTVDPERPEQHVLPHLLPGSKWAVFTVFPGTDFVSARLEAIELSTGRRKAVLPAGHDAAYVDSGYLVYGMSPASSGSEVRTRASLQAIRFDPVRVEVVGEAVSVVDSVTAAANSPTLNYSVARRGDLIFVPGGAALASVPTRRLVWVGRDGRETPIAAPPRSYAAARLSPDGTRVALDVRDQGSDIWIWDLNRQTLSVLGRHSAQDLSPMWTPDGKRVIWTSTRGGGNPNLFWQAADGTGAAERITTNTLNQFPTSITPDGNTIVVFGSSGNTTNAMDLYTVSLSQPQRSASLLVAAAGFDFGGELSPDGKWLAYHSNETGESQVYVRPFPNVNDGRWQISNVGGTRAVWSRDGRELFYLDRDGLLTSVSVTPGTAFTAGAPRQILRTGYYRGASTLGLDLRAYDISSDGRRFLMIKDPEAAPAGPPIVNITVVLNWLEELKQRLPSR